MPYAFPRIVLVLLAAALPGLPACEQRPPTVVARTPSDTETGALSLRARSSSRQAHGTYDPVTGRFLPARTTTRDYAVQLLAGRYLTVADVGAAGGAPSGVPWPEAGLRGEVHALGAPVLCLRRAVLGERVVWGEPAAGVPLG
jgi:hypothetical protein